MSRFTIWINLLLIACSLNLALERNLSAAESCCQDTRGNINDDPEDKINISDVTYLTAHLFGLPAGPAPECTQEGNTNGDPEEKINISDVTYLVAYLFGTGDAPDECPDWIRILNLEPGDNTVSGRVNILDPTQFKVVLWAKTDRWYIQPAVAQPYTDIQTDGTWSNLTYPWDRMAALLVDGSYVPGSVRDDHPAADPGVLDFDEYPDKSLRFIDWSGYRWRVKAGDLLDPGPNYFSGDPANVWIDGLGQLHLKTEFRDGKWYCAEVVMDEFLGYGTYTFHMSSRVDDFDYNIVFAGFLYETINQEFDIEFSKRLANPFNSQYVIQPYYHTGNITFFDMPADVQTSHSMEWRSDKIVFKSWFGHDPTPLPADIINSWEYTGADIPSPTDERMIFNLYLFGGEAPVGGLPDEAIISSFEFSE